MCTRNKSELNSLSTNTTRSMVAPCPITKDVVYWNGCYERCLF